MEKYICPVCGYPELSNPAWDIKTGTPSFDICSCCGCEFGYHDVTPHTKEKYRNDWVNNGANWFKPELTPLQWNLREQLVRIGIELDDLV